MRIIILLCFHCVECDLLLRLPLLFHFVQRLNYTTMTQLLSLSHTSFFSLLFLIHSYFMVIWNSTIHEKKLLKILASRGGLILTRGGWNFLLKISYLRWIFCLKSLDNNQISQILTKKLCSPALNPLLNEFGDFDGVWGFFTSPPLH